MLIFRPSLTEHDSWEKYRQSQGVAFHLRHRSEYEGNVAAGYQGNGIANLEVLAQSHLTLRGDKQAPAAKRG